MTFPVSIKFLAGETVSLQYNPEKETFPLENLYKQFSQYLENSNTNYLDEYIYKTTYIQLFQKEKQELIFPSKIAGFIPFKLFQIQNDDIKGDVENTFGVYFENSLEASIYFESKSISTDEYIYIKNTNDFYYKVSYSITIEMWHWYIDKDNSTYPTLDDSVHKYKYNSITFTVEILHSEIPYDSPPEKFFPCNRIKHVHVSRKGYDIAFDDIDDNNDIDDNKQGPVTCLKEAFVEELSMCKQLDNVKQETLNILADRLVEYEMDRSLLQ